MIMQARKRRSLRGPKKPKRKRSEGEERFEEDDLIIDDRDDARNEADEEAEDPLADETPAEKRIRIGALTAGITAP